MLRQAICISEVVVQGESGTFLVGDLVVSEPDSPHDALLPPLPKPDVIALVQVNPAALLARMPEEQTPACPMADVLLQGFRCGTPEKRDPIVAALALAHDEASSLCVYVLDAEVGQLAH